MRPLNYLVDLEKNTEAEDRIAWMSPSLEYWAQRVRISDGILPQGENAQPLSKQSEARLSFLVTSQIRFTSAW